MLYNILVAAWRTFIGRKKRKMKRSIVTIVIVILLIALLLTTALVGIDFLGVKPTAEGVTLGLDLVGGSRITYAPADSDGNEISATDAQMDNAVEVMRQRLTNLGYTEADVYVSGNSIVVEIPNISDPEEAVQTLGTTAQVQFRDCDGKVWLSGSDIKSASYTTQSSSSTGTSVNVVSLKFTTEGAEKFKNATAYAASQASGKNYIAIYLDDEEISQPTCEKEIDSDSAVD
jgi:preprotein translocase subunit SecD